MAEAKISLGEIDLLEGTLARGFCFPAANLVVLAAAELFGRTPTHGRRRLQRAAKFGTHRTSDRFQRAQRRRARGSSRARHRPFSRAATHGRPRNERSSRHRIRRRGEALCPARAGLHGLALCRRRKEITAAQFAGRREMDASKKKRRRLDFRLRGQNARAASRARDSARPRLRARHEMAARVRAFLPFPRNAGPAKGDRRNEARHGRAALDGSPDLRRRRLRQNRGRDPRRVQGGDGRETGRRPRARRPCSRSSISKRFASACSIIRCESKC